MKASVYHLELNVSDPKISFPFYKDLFAYLGFRITYEDKIIFGASNGELSFWIKKTEDKYKKNIYHRKNPGLNHLAFKVESQEDVDKFYKEFLVPRKTPILYNSPKKFPEYSGDYYAVYFEDPDRIKLEVVYNKD